MSSLSLSLSLCVDYTLFPDHIILSVHSDPVRCQRRCLQRVRCRKFAGAEWLGLRWCFWLIGGPDLFSAVWDAIEGGLGFEIVALVSLPWFPPLSGFLFAASVATIFSFVPTPIQAILFPRDGFNPEISDSVTSTPPLSLSLSDLIYPMSVYLLFVIFYFQYMFF